MYMCEKLRQLNSYKTKEKGLKAEDYEKIVFNMFVDIGYDNTIPVKIENIISNDLGIPVISNKFESSEKILNDEKIRKGILGKVQVKGENIDIYYNPRTTEDENEENEHRKRFTLAHELSHCILHAPEIGEDRVYVDFYRLAESEESYNNNDLREKEANILAGAILMPEEVISPLYKTLEENHNYIEIIDNLSNIFNVSRNVVRTRLEYLGLLK